MENVQSTVHGSNRSVEIMQKREYQDMYDVPCSVTVIQVERQVEDRVDREVERRLCLRLIRNSELITLFALTSRLGMRVKINVTEVRISYDVRLVRW